LLCSLIIHVFTWTIVIFFHNFSFAFTTCLTGSICLALADLDFQHAFRTKQSGFWLKLRDSQLFTWTLRSHCRVKLTRGRQNAMLESMWRAKLLTLWWLRNSESSSPSMAPVTKLPPFKPYLGKVLPPSNSAQEIWWKYQTVEQPEHT
jgi:hypothetical protein